MGAPLTAKYSKELGFSFNTTLGNNLILWKKAVMNQDIDCCIVVDGPEGSGKSVHAQQIAYFLDKDHDIDLEKQIVYDADAVRDAIHELPKHKAIMWDEAGEGLDRRESTKQANIDFNKMMKKARQHQKFLIFVLPSFYDLDMFAAVWRTRVLVHVWYDWDLDKQEQPLVRGFARFFNEAGKKNLYTNKLWRQQYKYPYIRNNSFDYTFPHHYVVDEQAYRDNKKKADELQESEHADKRKRCPDCKSTSIRWLRTEKNYHCRKCPWEGPTPAE